MKNKVKKSLLAVTSLLMAGVLTTSFAIQTSMKNSGDGILVNNEYTLPDGVSVVPDSYAKALNSSQFIDEKYKTDYLPENLNVHNDGTRRVIVELESDAQMDTYLESKALRTDFSDFTSYVNAREGRLQADLLKKEQDEFLAQLKKTGVHFEIRHTYTSILNAVSIVVDNDDVRAIEKLDGVKNVIYSEVYNVPTVEPTVNVVDVYGTGIYDSSDIQYKGDGMLVAVLDTGLDIAHNAFRTMPQVEKVTLSDIEEVFDDLDAKTYGQEITAEDVYYNAKVPFAYDYADGDPDVFAISNSHGVHVAGIIAGQDDSVTEKDGQAFENGKKFIGVAPNAQLFIGKVFPDTDDGMDNGAETDDILAALADCVTVGTDVINMSLGSSCGFSREEDGDAINAIYDKVYAAGINLVVAASNSYSSAMNGAYGSTNLTSNPDSSTVGSPSTYVGALSVASISGQKSSYILLDDGTAVYFNESSNAAGQKGQFVEELLNGADKKTFNYVVVPGFGRPSNYTSSVQAELQKGNCIAVVSRGDISFEEKQKNAFDNGAVACIIYNNMSGKISASLGTGKEIPTCTVSAAIGQRFVQNGKGTVTLDKTFKAGPFMSDFSSWGPTNDLKIKPEITAHGGEITSAVVGGYDKLSGTSMASPNMAGAVTLLRQHVAEKYQLSGTELSNRVNQLLMSTATIVYDENGLPYSIRKQGAGLGDIGKAMSTEAYLYVENNAKPKLELGDDPSRTGVYTMEFHVRNTASAARTYKLNVMAMTESVSIDNITVEEKAYMLDNAQKSYRVNGRVSNGSFTVEGGADATVTVTLALSATEKAYIEENFKNGMYVEGFVTLDDLGDGVDLSIPYLAYYGDWTDAPIFDKSAYEVSADYYDSSIPDEEKQIAAIYESIAIGRYAKEYEDFYLPMGEYIYSLPEGVDSGVVSSVDKIAVGNNEYGIYEFYAMYFGMLRAAREMHVRVENAVTGEVLKSETQYNIRKSYSARPTFSELELNPYELGLKNNEKYTVVFEAMLDYDNGKTKWERQEFSFYVDYQAPLIYNSNIRYEDDGNGGRRAWLDLELYDNHYVQSVQLFSVVSDSDVNYLTDYAIPVTNGLRDSTTKLSIEITKYMDNFKNSYGEYANKIGVRLDDYALNGAAYTVTINPTIVDSVEVNYTYDDEGTEKTASLAGQTVMLRPGQELDLAEDSGIVSTGTGTLEVDFSVNMIGYTTYTCTHPDAHGIACGFAFNERTGYTYVKGDYFYNVRTGKVVQKDSNDTRATYLANTQFITVIAEAVEKNGNRYVKPESKHFVCPKCGTEETFTFNARTGKITTQTFEKDKQDPMIFDVLWTSNNTSVVKVENGKLYAVGAGTATITASPTATETFLPFTFTVKVEDTAVDNFIEGITVGSYYNRTLNESHTVNGSALVECGSVLDLFPKITPWYVTGIADLTWESASPDIVEIISSSATTARVVCKKPGAASILLTSASNSLIGRFTIVVDEEFTLTSYYFYEYNGVGYSETYEEAGETRKILVIPANLGILNIGYYSKLDLRDGVFENNQTLDTVVVPQGVTMIGREVFANSSIRRIYLPSSIEGIAKDAFRNSAIEEIFWYDASEFSGTKIVYDADNNTYNWEEFYKEVTVKSTAKRMYVGSYAFAYCNYLETCDLSRVTAMYKGAFSYCSKLTTADLSNLRYAETHLFQSCDSLTNVIMNADTVVNGYTFMDSGLERVDFYGTVISENLFAKATSLTEVVIHNDVKYIGSGAFEGCIKLNSITFNGTCGYIGARAFKGCAALATFAVPAGVELIGAEAFANCSALEKLDVSPASNIQNVGLDVFKGCSVLKRITVSGSNKGPNYNTATTGEYEMLTNASGSRIILMPPTYALTVNGNVFTVPLQIIDSADAVTEIGGQAYANMQALDGKEVVIPEGITKIGFGAFQGSGITKIVIPASVTEIDAYAFYNCKKLETVVFLCDIKEIAESTFYGCTKLSYIQIPGSVEVIGDYAFAGTAIKSFDVAENVSTIGKGAFLACSNLAQVTFAQQSQLVEIGENAFYSCVALEKIVMPDTVQTIGDYAFASCTSITDVYVSSGLTDMGSYVFSNDLSLEKFVMGDGAEMLGDYAFFTPYKDSGLYYQRSLADVTIPQSVKYIGDFAFGGNTVIETLDLSGVRYIGVGAFYYTTALTTVVISDEMETIDNNAFYYSAITTIDLSKVEYFGADSFINTAVQAGNFANAISIGARAFYGCKNITEVSLPNVKVIGDSAFFTRLEANGSQANATITKVTIGNKLETLGGAVFFNSLITEIVLPASLKEIGAPAFAGCLKLQTITVADGNSTFFVDKEYGGLYKNNPNGTYELVAVPNALVYDKVDEDYTKLEPFKILDKTSRIGTWAMGYCMDIHAVEIPASVKSIGANAFYYMGLNILNKQATGSSRAAYPKYIFKGLQAPTLESMYVEGATSLMEIYSNFSYPLGYLINDMVIPVNASGFESVLYRSYFMKQEYSAELIEPDTQSLIDWLNGLDVNALTLADEKTVTEMNMVYFMMSKGQKAFISDENVAKLNAAVAKIAELKA